MTGAQLARRSGCCQPRWPAHGECWSLLPNCNLRPGWGGARRLLQKGRFWGLLIALEPLSPQHLWICPSLRAPTLAPNATHSSIHATWQLEIPWDWDLTPELNG